MADVLVTLPNGEQRVVDEALLRLPPAQEPPPGSYVRVAVTGLDEVWFSTGRDQWAATDDPATPHPWSFVVARDLAAQPTTVFLAGNRLVEAITSRVLVNNLRVLATGGTRIRVRRSAGLVEVSFGASTDTITAPAAVALALGALGAAR